MEWPQCVSLLLLMAGAFHLLEAANNNNHRRNLFDPIYAFDDIDAHTVSAGTNNQPDQGNYRAQTGREPARRAPIDTTASSHFSTNDNDDVDNQNSSTASALPPRPTRARPATAPSASAPTTTSTITNAKPNRQQPQQQTSHSPRPNTKRQVVVSSLSATTSSGTSLSANESSVGTTAAVTSTPKKEEPVHHWSALENYYDKLRQSALAKQAQQQPLNAQQAAAYYQLLQQEMLEEHSLSGSRPIYRGAGLTKSSRPTGLSDANLNLNLNQNFNPAYVGGPPKHLPFLLPLMNVSASAQPSFSSGASVGASTGSLLKTPSPYSLADITPLEALLLDMQQYYRQLQQQQGGPKRYGQQQSAGQPQAPPATLSANSGAGAGAGAGLVRDYSPIQSAGPWAQNYDDASKMKLLELRKLPELLISQQQQQQQQQRLKHQQDTFGMSWHDYQRIRELLQGLLSSYCGPRNVNVTEYFDAEGDGETKEKRSE